MKNRKIVKIIVCIIMLLIFILYMQPSYASNIIKEAQEWFEGGKAGGETIMNPQDTANAIAPISQLLFWAGIITLFIAGTVMGIKFIMASPEEQGKLKGQLIGLVIAAIVILGAYTIWELSYNFMNEVVNSRPSASSAVVAVAKVQNNYQ